jgi:hypothetical protein
LFVLSDTLIKQHTHTLVDGRDGEHGDQVRTATREGEGRKRPSTTWGG